MFWYLLTPFFCIIGKYTCVGDVASNSNGGGQSRYAVPPEPRTILDSKEAKFQGPSECWKCSTWT